MFFRIVIPPVLYALGLLLVLLSLLSPVPYHSSSISLIYISPSIVKPAPSNTQNANISAKTFNKSSIIEGRSLDNLKTSLMSQHIKTTSQLRSSTFEMSSKIDKTTIGSASPNFPDLASLKTASLDQLLRKPPRLNLPTTQTSVSNMLMIKRSASAYTLQTQLNTNTYSERALYSKSNLERRDISSSSGSALALSNVKFSIGLMGSCFGDVNNTYQCTPSSLHPHYNYTWLSNSPGVEFDTSMLPVTLSAEPAFVLLTFLILLILAVVQARRVHVTAVSYTGALSRQVLLLLKISTFVQDSMAIVLLFVMISLRVRVSKFINEFNNANKNRLLGPDAFSHDSPIAPPLSLHADTGTEFSCICASAILFLILSWLERRRLRYEQSNTQTALRSQDTKTDSARPWRECLLMPLRNAVRPEHSSITISAPINMSPVSLTPSSTKHTECPTHFPEKWSHPEAR